MGAAVEFSYGDLRIDRVAREFYQRIIEKSSICIRAIAETRKKEVSFHRLIKNEKFTTDKMIQECIINSQSNMKSIDHILCIQDTSELNFQVDGKNNRVGLGPLTSSFCKGFFIHPGLLVDANSYAILGVSDVIHWTRQESIHLKDENGKSIKNNEYKKLLIEEKESYRWIELAKNTKSRFSHVKKLTVIADRESDIYEEWDRVPDHKTYLLTRASRDRTLFDKSSLYDMMNKFTPLFCYKIDLAEITNKRKNRTAELEVSYGSVKILKPKNCKDTTAKKSIMLNSILVKEVTKDVPEKDKILWRLLTTHDVSNPAEARQIITWYSKRWLIEQLFRTLKSQGINVESSQVENGESLKKIAIAGIFAAVKTMQLVQARDGTNDREINDVFQDEDYEILKNINEKVEGKTEKQKNPHKIKSLAWGSWIIRPF